MAYLRPIFRTSELHCKVVKYAEVAIGEDWSCGLIRAAYTNKVLGDVIYWATHPKTLNLNSSILLI